ncbi:hypothetical protein [Micromonospora sp. NBC_01813]|uniref:hypothetical protein n=1 Tax=Micromonospora sp. NBC_01813 TaxID=2975988 RepID=UPI002DDB16F4|nr:hypothetical protein [Micromonospora sp. NBC_01813]WSA12469.1 hypothetical protein OG958_02645 [Micromonospora sp. NBC_01813]
MSTGRRDATVDLIAIPRAVVSLAAEVVHSMERAVVGDDRIRTARGNAWEAICADRARAHQRDEIRRLVAALATDSVATSPAHGTAAEGTAESTAGRRETSASTAAS